jgi:protein-disulfide isomerase-like protein with CxxC motif
LPSGDFVYNSTRACVAVEVVRELTGRAPFDYLLRLQDRFFRGAQDVTNPALLIAEAAAVGLGAKRFEALLHSPEMLRRVRDGFTAAKSHGTGALPSVLLEAAGVRRLVSGGYIDAPTLIDSLHAFL